MSLGHIDSGWWTQESVCLQRTNVMVIITIYNTYRMFTVWRVSSAYTRAVLQPP